MPVCCAQCGPKLSLLPHSCCTENPAPYFSRPWR
ncbi:MAG TPA: hypothetical protein DIW53_19700 [Achromobacter sp.]|nr:hypothetical protein [Achromobacter sp.]